MTVEIEVRVLYQRLLDAWNARSAQDFAALFAEDGSLIGYDGSQLNGRVEIEASLGRIFKDHLTASYINIVREVRSLSADVVLLRAVAGMVPHGKTDLNPEVNAIQSLVAQKSGGGWQIALFQNTPAQFHGRPDLAQQLIDELSRLI
jgi:uncharacterized protein (TIGR02246 family)